MEEEQKNKNKSLGCGKIHKDYAHLIQAIKSNAFLSNQKTTTNIFLYVTFKKKIIFDFYTNGSNWSIGY